MKRTTALMSVVLVGTSLALLSCSKKTTPARVPGNTSHTPTDTAHVDPQNDWKLTYKGECKNIDAEACLGSYGFSLTADGKFKVGPGPTGQTKTGDLAPEELKDIHALVNKSWGAQDFASLTAESCQAPADATQPIEESHSIILNRAGADKQIVQLGEKGFCFQSANADDARKLHDSVLAIVKRYYALPFPDNCADAAATLDALHATLRSCSADADCAYINGNYSAIPNESSEYVLTDACTRSTPMAVGNAVNVAANQQKLIESLSRVEESCGARYFRDDCLDVAGFFSSAAAPVCQQGVCRINPNIPLR